MKVAGDASPVGRLEARSAERAGESYVYLNLGGLYVEQSQGMARLTYLLLRYGRNFPFDGRLAARGWGWVPPRLLRLARVIRLSWLARSEFRSAGRPEGRDAIVSEHWGNIALRKKSGGYCVIDLERQTATWSLAGAISASEFAHRIEIQQQMSRSGIAARVRRVAPEQQVVVEDYLDGRRLPPVSVAPDAYQKAARPIIRALLGMGVSRVTVGDYLDGLLREIAPIVERRRMSGWEQVEQLLFSCQRILVTSSAHPIGIYPSHGDLTEKNMFVVAGRPLAIDWETYDRRSVLYDVYTHFMSAICRTENRTAGDLEPLLSRMYGAGLAMTHSLDDGGAGRRDAGQGWYPCLFLVELVSAKLRQLVLPVMCDERRFEKRAAWLRRYAEVAASYCSWRGVI
jgi:hypothetical protein